MTTNSSADALLQRVSRRLAYALLGAALAVGAPAGLLLVRFVAVGEGSFTWMLREITDNVLTYAYVTVSTTIVFVLFGWRLGRQADRLIELSTTDRLTGLLNRRGFYAFPLPGRPIEQRQRAHDLQPDFPFVAVGGLTDEDALIRHPNFDTFVRKFLR